MASWQECNHSVGFTDEGESGHALADDGYLGFACRQPMVVLEGQVMNMFDDENNIIPVAVLHNVAKITDNSVMQKLSAICGACRFFQPKN